jgi:hypothetical protein
MATSVERIDRAVRKLARLSAELSQVTDALAQIAGGADPLLFFESRPGDRYPLPKGGIRSVLEAEQAQLTTKVAETQAQIDAAAQQVD